tara:strand:+ start:212 stop:526 length:315 start_codon:yes stop_codon:yes gene_type:complete
MCNLLSIKNKNFTKTFLFSLISCALINPVMANDAYWYGYSWGGMFAACSAYKYNQMSKNDAKFMVKTFLGIGKDNLNDRDTYLKLKNLQTLSPFIDDCSNLISY